MQISNQLNAKCKIKETLVDSHRYRAQITIAPCLTVPRVWGFDIQIASVPPNDRWYCRTHLTSHPTKLEIRISKCFVNKTLLNTVMFIRTAAMSFTGFYLQICIQQIVGHEDLIILLFLCVKLCSTFETEVYFPFMCTIFSVFQLCIICIRITALNTEMRSADVTSLK